MFAKTKNIAFVSLFFFTILFLFSGKAYAIEYGMLGGKPANPDPNIENSSSWFIYNLNAGESKQDAITVMNLFDNPLDIILYPADSTNSSNGGFALKQITEPKEEVGDWVKFYSTEVPKDFADMFQKHEGNIVEFCKLEQEALQDEFGKIELTSQQFSELEKWCQGTDLIERTLDSKETVNIPFVISIPEKADVGEHTGGILIQKKVVDDQAGSNAGSTVKLTTRVGVRIYQTVPGDIIRKLSLDDFKVIKNFPEFSFSDWFGEKKPREYLVQSNISNTGNVSVEHENNVLISRLLFGKDTQLVERKFQVMKKDKFIANMSWEKPLFGYYAFQSQIKYQGTDKEEILLSAPVKLLIMPWREMTLALIALGILVGIYFAWRYYNKKKYGGIGWVERFVQEGDTVANLSAKYDVDWKVLVKTNKIKAPFLLEAGQIILVPSSGDDASEQIIESENVETVTLEIPQEEPMVEIKKRRGRPAKVITQEKNVEEAVLVQEVQEEEKVEVKRDYSFVYKTALMVIAVGILIALSFVAYSMMSAKKVAEQGMSINSLMTQPVVEKVAAPDEQPAQPVSVEEEKIDQATLSINVLNGGAAPGLAGKIKDFLLTKGYVVVEAKNAENDDNSSVVVYYTESKFEKEAKWIAEILASQKLKAEAKEASTDEQKASDIAVILGK